ncbi:MAG: type IV pilus modification protein PilV [Methylococcales bacterium]|nr:type IV pilus modification protein PilV [Methylococcales bacterium]
MINNKGFTLIEVLIAMFVLAFGLIGLAAVQMTGLRNNLSAHNRIQATILAYDMADRMRANVADTTSLANPALSTYNTMVANQAQVKNACKLIANACTSAEMAENDLFEWNRMIAGGVAVEGPPAMAALPATLPLGQGTITGTVSGAAPNQYMMYTITINWDDNRDGTRDLSFQMSFQL